jgi:hypothetical protein
MPKPGYKSITVSERTCLQKFFKVYDKSKNGLEIKGIRSFSAYLHKYDGVDFTVILQSLS